MGFACWDDNNKKLYIKLDLSRSNPSSNRLEQPNPFESFRRPALLSTVGYSEAWVEARSRPFLLKDLYFDPSTFTQYNHTTMYVQQPHLMRFAKTPHSIQSCRNLVRIYAGVLWIKDPIVSCRLEQPESARTRVGWIRLVAAPFRLNEAGRNAYDQPVTCACYQYNLAGL